MVPEALRWPQLGATWLLCPGPASPRSGQRTGDWDSASSAWTRRPVLSVYPGLRSNRSEQLQLSGLGLTSRGRGPAPPRMASPGRTSPAGAPGRAKCAHPLQESAPWSVTMLLGRASGPGVCPPLRLFSLPALGGQGRRCTPAFSLRSSGWEACPSLSVASGAAPAGGCGPGTSPAKPPRASAGVTGAGALVPPTPLAAARAPLPRAPSLRSPPPGARCREGRVESCLELASTARSMCNCVCPSAFSPQAQASGAEAERRLAPHRVRARWCLRLPRAPQRRRGAARGRASVPEPRAAQGGALGARGQAPAEVPAPPAGVSGQAGGAWTCWGLKWLRQRLGAERGAHRAGNALLQSPTG